MKEKERISNRRSLVRLGIILTASLLFGVYLHIMFDSSYFLFAAVTFSLIIAQFVKLCSLDGKTLYLFYPFRILVRKKSVPFSSIKKIIYSKSTDGRNNPYLRIFTNHQAIPIEIQPDREDQFDFIIKQLSSQVSCQLIEKG